MNFIGIVVGTFLGNMLYAKCIENNIDEKIQDVIRKKWLE